MSRARSSAATAAGRSATFANLGPPVDTAHELLVIEHVGKEPLGVSSRAQDRWTVVRFVPSAEAVGDMDRNDPKAERLRQLCCDPEC